MKAFFDHKPSNFEAIGSGAYAYRYNITEEQKPSTEEDNAVGTQWSCEEIIVYAPISSNKITEKVLTERWENNYEQKLINEFNAAQLGLLTEEEAQARTTAYRTFLAERASLKAQVDAVCKEHGIQ